MRIMRIAAMAALGPLLMAPRVDAHHAFSAEFDANRPIKFEATVTKMEWINPHAWIYVDVERPDGTIEKWMIEAGTPNTLLRRGLTRDSLLPGAEIVVDGYQSKDGSLRANGRDLTFPNGETVFLGGSSIGAPEREDDPRE